MSGVRISISDQNVLMKDAAQKTPRKSAVFSHIYQFFRCKKLENEIFQRHDLRARAVRVGLNIREKKEK